MRERAEEGQSEANALSPSHRHAAGKRESARIGGSPASSGTGTRLTGSPKGRSPGGKRNAASSSTSFEKEMTLRYSGLDQSMPRVLSADDPVSMSILDTMRMVSKEERLSHELELENASLRLQNKFHGGVAPDVLAQRKETLTQMEAHLRQLVKVPRDTLATRLLEPFARPHLSLPAKDHDEVEIEQLHMYLEE